jgi:hypothetical protein
VPINGHVCGLALAKHRGFAMATDEMSQDEFTRFLTTVFGNLAAHVANDRRAPGGFEKFARFPSGEFEPAVPADIH